MGKMLDPREMTIATVDARLRIVEEIEREIALGHLGIAGQMWRYLCGFDNLAELVGILPDQSAEREDLNRKIIDKLSMPWEEARVHAE